MPSEYVAVGFGPALKRALDLLGPDTRSFTVNPGLLGELSKRLRGDWPAAANDLAIDQRNETIVLAYGEKEGKSVLDIYRDLEKNGYRVMVTEHVFTGALKAMPVAEVGYMNVLETEFLKVDTVGYTVVKRIFDIILSLFCLVLFSPVFIIIPMLIRVLEGGSVLYRQDRLGEHGKILHFVKFRTMAPNTDHDTEGRMRWTRKADVRVSKLGKIIRKFDMDELPQLLMILKGDMTFVGPRAELPFFIDRFKDTVPRYVHRLRIKNGLTGLAQIYGYRGDTPLAHRARYDLEYIRQWSLWLDIKILFFTVFRTKMRDPGSI